MIGAASNNISQKGGHITVLERVADFNTISCNPPIPKQNKKDAELIEYHQSFIPKYGSLVKTQIVLLYIEQTPVVSLKFIKVRVMHLYFFQICELIYYMVALIDR